MATDKSNLTSSNSTVSETNPIKTLDATAPPSPSPDRVDNSSVAKPTDFNSGTDGHKDGEDSKTNSGSAVESLSGNNALVSDTEKKIRRAERFGITVQLSEQEKRNSRAERFGTAGTTKNSEPEDFKRKARAERFGLPVSADEEAKKKARLERFSSTSKTDAQEEEKRKARDIRFSQTSSNSLSTNDKGNVEPKVAIAGKAGGGS